MVEIKTETVVVKATKPFFTPQKHPRWLRKLEQFIRVKIFRQPRYLIDQWTIEKCEELEAVHGFDLEEELTKILTEEIERSTKENGSMTWKEFCDSQSSK